MIPIPPDGSFEHVHDTESIGNLAQIASVISAILHYRGPANHFELSNPGEIIENLILDSVRKVSVISVRADVIKGKDCDAFFGGCRFHTSLIEQASSISRKKGHGD